MNTISNTQATTAERSQRSVFVGNIPYEATEEELKELFSQVGPVAGFRLVFDRENGKPKGYGFCEFLDQETALSALRNLNQFEFHGRNLRVDTAAGDRSKEELRQLQMTFGGPSEESPYGPPCEPDKAPEAISRAVASLPPEQMFELMKQMKLCIQNNPNEARNMLLQNPQLAYALLQAQVVMRIVDPQVAMSMLHRETTAPNLLPPPQQAPVIQPVVQLPQFPVQVAPPSTMSMPPLPQTGRDIDYRMIPNTTLSQTSTAVPKFVASQPPSSFMMPPQPLSMPQIGSGLRAASALQTSANIGIGSSGINDEQERAALIMQVLQLTDQQISLLPADQKQSVLILRDQLRNAQK